MRRYTVVLTPDRDRGGYTVSVPAMPGAASFGDTREAALDHIREAMEGWLEAAFEDGLDAEPETPQLIAKEIGFVLDWRAELGWDPIVETAEVELPAFATAA